MESIGGMVEKGAVPRPYNLSAEERNKHLDMMKTPDNWPRWPFLPVKQPQSIGLPKCGLIYEQALGNEVKPIVYDCLLWTLSEFKSDNKLAEFRSFEDMIDAGWVVD